MLEDEATKLELVSAGVGLALLEYSEASAAAEAGRVVLWPAETIPCALSLVSTREREHEPLIAAEVQEVLQVGE